MNGVGGQKAKETLLSTCKGLLLHEPEGMRGQNNAQESTKRLSCMACWLAWPHVLQTHHSRKVAFFGYQEKFFLGLSILRYQASTKELACHHSPRFCAIQHRLGLSLGP